MGSGIFFTTNERMGEREKPIRHIAWRNGGHVKKGEKFMLPRKNVYRLSDENMVFRPLFFLQEKLDQKINARFDQDEEIAKENFLKKVVGFRVEMGELLNATRLHKYWSASEPESKERALDEYADGLHFLLSIGGEKKVTDFTYKGLYDGEIQAQDIMWLCDKLMTIPWVELRKEDYLLGLEMYLKLGELLLFTWEEIRNAYVTKNIENQERQNTGY